MANETIYNPGDMSFGNVALQTASDYFPELDPHFDFNNFIANNPDVLGGDYNVLGAMDVADRIPESKWYGGMGALSTLGGLYNIVDTWKEPAQDWKEGFSDFYRNIKGLGIQRDRNLLFGSLYNEDEADYYKGLYKKVKTDYQKKKQFEENKILMNVAGGTFDRPGPGPKPGGGGGSWSPSGADLSPGGGYGQSPTGSDIAGTPFSRGGILGAF